MGGMGGMGMMSVPIEPAQDPERAFLEKKSN
jgi:hypothetical protein